MDSDKPKFFDLKFSIIILGDSAIGKSSLVCRFTEDKFHPVFLTTIGEKA